MHRLASFIARATPWHRIIRAGSHLLALVVLAAACASPQPGRFALDWTWQDGMPANVQALYARAEVRTRDDQDHYRVVLAMAGPISLGQQRDLVFGDVPYGDDCVVYVEIKASPDDDQAVLYYGISSPFALAESRSVQPTIRVALRAVLPTESADSVHLVARDARATITSTGTPFVDLLVRMPRAVTAHIANSLPGLDHHPTVVPIISNDDITRIPWDVENDVSTRDPCGARECVRYVYVRFFDAEGYPSQPMATFVALDRQPPSIRADASQIMPAVATGNTLISVRIAFSEPITPDSVALALTRNNVEFTTTFDQISNDTWQLRSTLAQIISDPGRYAIQLKGVRDLHGNTLQEGQSIAIGEFIYDPTTPRITDTRIPAQIFKAWDSLHVGFVLDETLPTAATHARAQLGDQDLDCATTSLPNMRTQFACSLLITPSNTIAIGTEANLPLTFRAWDDANNETSVAASIALDFKPPTHQSLPPQPFTYVPGQTLVQGSITWSEPMTEVRLIAVQRLGSNHPATFAFTAMPRADAITPFRSLRALSAQDAGAWSMLIEGIDQAGNASALETVSFNIRAQGS